MIMTGFNNVLGAYDNLVKEAPILAHIHGETEYEAALEFIEVLMDLIGDHPQDPRWGLLEIATKAVDVYEAQNYPELDELSEQHHSSVAVLRVLMDQYRLGKSDFPEIGNQQAVEEVMEGKKDMTIGQVKALSTRFNIDPALFL